MAVCPSTGLVVKNTFIDGEPDVLAGISDSPKRSKSCVARFSNMSPHFFWKEHYEGSTDDDASANHTDTEGEESDAWSEVGLQDKAEHSCASLPTSLSYSSTSFTGHVSAPSGDFLFYSGPIFPVDCNMIHTGIKEVVTPAMHLQPYLQACAASDTVAGSLPSIGSQCHGTSSGDGQPACRPCAWYHKVGGCANGAACTYCHLCSKDEMKNRKKEKIARFRTVEHAQ